MSTIRFVPSQALWDLHSLSLKKSHEVLSCLFLYSGWVLHILEIFLEYHYKSSWEELRWTKQSLKNNRTTNVRLGVTTLSFNSKHTTLSWTKIKANRRTQEESDSVLPQMHAKHACIKTRTSRKGWKAKKREGPTRIFVESILIGYNVFMITNLNDELLQWVDQNSLQTALIVVYADCLQLRTGWDMRSRHWPWLQNKIRSDQAETNWLTSRTV